MQVNSPETIHKLISKDKEQFNVLTENFWESGELYNCDNFIELPLKIKNNPKNWMFSFEVGFENIDTKMKECKVMGVFYSFKELILHSKNDNLSLDDTDRLHLNGVVIPGLKHKQIYTKFIAYKFKTDSKEIDLKKEIDELKQENQKILIEMNDLKKLLKDKVF
jgi:hypothetical protein